MFSRRLAKIGGGIALLVVCCCGKAALYEGVAQSRDCRERQPADGDGVDDGKAIFDCQHDRC